MFASAQGESDVDVSALRGAVSGYLVDSPACARDAIGPLMAAYDFTVAEREGAFPFFIRITRQSLGTAALTGINRAACAN
ncbi:MAG: hypothetical protein IPG56_18680 [Caulobacteraceae bacterium]|nr:hypothetical protein [Caulobacteraceae bacterium]